MVNEKYRRAIFVVVYHRRKNIFGRQKINYLILERKKNWIGWEFPKGGIEKGERISQALEREIFEETGQKVTHFKKHNFSGKYKYSRKLDDKPRFIGQTFSLYSAEVNSRKIKFDEREHSGYRWVDFKNAIKFLTWKNQRDALTIVNDFLNN